MATKKKNSIQPTRRKRKHNVKQPILKNDELPQSALFSTLLGDVLWLSTLLITGYVILCLLSFSPNDAAWSHSTTAIGEIRNLGGIVGAYIADIAYYLAGFSIWFFVLATLVWLIKNFAVRNKRTPNDRRYWHWLGIFGSFMLVLSSSIIERMIGGEQSTLLPQGFGGVLGKTFAPSAISLFGISGSMIIFISLIVISLSFILQISWLDLLESVGKQLERLFNIFFKKPYQFIEEQTESSSSRRMKKIERINEHHVHRELDTTVHKGREQKISIENEIPKNNRLVQKDLPLSNDEQNRTNDSEVSNLLPSLDFLSMPKDNIGEISQEKLQATAENIEKKLSEFGIQVKVVRATAGPVVTRYEIELAQGVKGNQVVNLSKDLARNLSLQSVRIVETIKGRNTMGIELPNDVRQGVILREILESDVFQNSSDKLTIALGKNISGSPVIANLAKMPHLLVAGTTGSGKSIGIHSIIASLLYRATADDLRLLMVDPKMLELLIYQDIPHLLCPVITDMKQASTALAWCVKEMDKRYRLLAHVGVRGIDSFNEKIKESQENNTPIPNPFSLTPDEPEPLQKMPYIVVIIDEFADLMMTGDKKKIEDYIVRLAQKARACGIHLILATQRPSVEVITGIIKANIPTRIAFQVASKIDSRTILDQMGAENLLGQGDMLFLPPGEAFPVRLHGSYVDVEHELTQIISWIKLHSSPRYIDEVLEYTSPDETNSSSNATTSFSNEDELYDAAVKFVLESKKTSISALQRHLRIGYNRSANLIEAMEKNGVVSPAEVGNNRKILVSSD